MKFEKSIPPYIRVSETVRTMMMDTLIALLPLYCLAYYFYGVRSIILAGISVLTCVCCDMAGILLSQREVIPMDLSPVITGLIIPLLFPASIDYKIVAVAAAFAILVVKQPFGGIGQNIFNPAAAGVAFATICWSRQVFSFPTPLYKLGISSKVEARLSTSPAAVLKLDGIPTVDYMDMLLGNFAGPMGSTAIIVLISCLIYMVVRRTASIKITGAYFLVTVFLAFFFPRGNMTGAQSVMYEMMSGSLIFGAIFLLNDPVTSPQRDLSRIIYGAFTGFVVMIFRRFGKFEDGVVFAILFSNAFVWAVDMLCEEIQRKMRHSNSENK